MSAYDKIPELMSPDQPPSESDVQRAEADVKRVIGSYGISLASVGAQVGGITVIVIFVALAIGLWLDNRFHTRPTLTMLFVLGSVPVSLGLMFWVVKRATRRMMASTQKKAAQEKDQTQIDKE
jgi:hypothetical protein